MDVVLKQDVAGLGKAGDVVRVKDGYARNYLIPRGLAVPATEGALRQRRTLKDAQLQKEQRQKAEAERHAAQPKGKPWCFTQRRATAGFSLNNRPGYCQKIGSVFKIQVGKGKCCSLENLKQLGTHTVHIQLHPEVRVEVTVEIRPEGGKQGGPET